jgi:hypothetical protein
MKSCIRFDSAGVQIWVPLNADSDCGASGHSHALRFNKSSARTHATLETALESTLACRQCQ